MDDRFDDGGGSRDDHEALSAELQLGEKVVWTGEPTPWLMVRRSLGLSLFGLIYGTFAVFLFVSATQQGGYPLGKARRPFASTSEWAAFTCITVGLTAFGGFMLTAPLRALWRARKTSYMLTDCRALVFEPRRLFGGRRLHAFTPEALKLMQCKERGDGSGDLVFDRRMDDSGWWHPVGFVGVDRVREIESLVRRKLIDVDRGSSPLLPDATGVWRLRFSSRCFIALYLSFFLLFIMYWAIPGAALMAIIVCELVTGRRDIGDADPFVLGVLVGVPLLWLAIIGLYSLRKSWFAFPFEIEIGDDRMVTFRNWFGKRVVPVADVVSIRNGGWLEPQATGAVVRHKQGRVYILNEFPNFREFASTMKALNPSIDVRIF